MESVVQKNTCSDESAELPPLRFEGINEMLDAYAATQRGGTAGPVERWAFVAGMFGAGGGLLLGALLSGSASLNAAVAGLIIELVGLGVWLALFIKREWQTFPKARKSLAIDLDDDFILYSDYVAQLRRYPEDTLQRRLRYIHDRSIVMKRRLGFFTGGVERLGVLPILAVLYFQFKGWQFGDWAMLAEVNLVQGLLLWALVLGYAASWRLIRLHSRVEAFELLLTEAVHDAAS